MSKNVLEDDFPQMHIKMILDSSRREFAKRVFEEMFSNTCWMNKVLPQKPWRSQHISSSISSKELTSSLQIGCSKSSKVQFSRKCSQVVCKKHFWSLQYIQTAFHALSLCGCCRYTLKGNCKRFSKRFKTDWLGLLE